MQVFTVEHLQLQRTQYSSLYAAQVMQTLDGVWQADYAVDGFKVALNTETIQQLVRQTLAACENDATWMRAIRQLRARLMLRWIWQDCNELTDVLQLTRELSDFADACVLAAKEYARPALVARYGQPIGDNGIVQDLIIIAMGKHGAHELNLSSDIDLIFAFDENGSTDGRKSIDVQQFCIAWGQKIIQLLEQTTADGFVFRVDMRLRPWGDGSALALSHAALEKYLVQHGREWERYAWIKARVINPSAEGHALMRMARPFVFRRYVDYTAFAAMRDMKAMIEKEVARRSYGDDVKLGAGGIREIEFIVQVFQLIYGGAKPELQERQCLTTLRYLADEGLLTQDAADELRAAYLFLRRVEHAIQALQDQQTQTLPTDNDLKKRLIFALHFLDWDTFIQRLNDHRQRVSFYFSTLIQTRINSPVQVANSSTAPCTLDDEQQQYIESFWQSQAVQRLPSDALERLKTFWSPFIEALSQAQAPGLALTRLLPLIESILRRSVYLVMLVENPGALQRLVKMAEASPWICEELARYPVLLDEFLSLEFVLPERTELIRSLQQQLLRIEVDQTEEIMRALRLFKKSNVLAVAACDVLAQSPLMRVSDVLTDIAEVTMTQALHLAYQITVKRHGYPLGQDGERCGLDRLGFAVIGYGKVGGIELGYGSDLDVIFLHDYQEQAETDGHKPITSLEFAIRLAQKLMSLLTTQTLDGRVYEIDTRLRPNGEAGLLACSINAFLQYQLYHAWVWEHQALVRARAIAGDRHVIQQFDAIRQQILMQTRNTEQLKQEVLEMRRKMHSHLGSSQTQQQQGVFHLKQDIGGIVDIEFIAQYLVLAWSADYANLAQFSDNVRILQQAAMVGCISQEAAEALTHAYLTERAASHQLALAQQTLQVEAAAWQPIRQVVAQLWKQWIEPDLDDSHL